MLYFDDGILIAVSEDGNEGVVEGGNHRGDPNDADCSFVVYAAPDPCAASHSH